MGVYALDNIVFIILSAVTIILLIILLVIQNFIFFLQM